MQVLQRTADHLDRAEIIETIGPPEDPSIEDCLKTLALPVGIAGCAIDEVGVRSAATGQAAGGRDPSIAAPPAFDPLPGVMQLIDLSALRALHPAIPGLPAPL
ncbi:hypothetical protein [Sphingomonas qilianensis]